MKKLNVGFCIRDQEYAEVISSYLKKIDLTDIDIIFISEEHVDTEFKNLSVKNYLNKGEKKNIELDPKIWKNKNIYKADPRYINKKGNINREFQNSYTEACRKIFNTYKFDLLFSGSAGRLIWTVPHLVALEKSVLAYKLVPSDYLNPRFEGIRFWFCTDIFWDIDLNSEFDFEWSEVEIETQIENLQRSLLSENFNLASRALLSRENYTPKKLLNIIKNIIKIILQNDYLSKLRIKSFINSIRNKKFYTLPEKLNKEFILYPLNQPHDEQLLVRAPKYLDTVENIKLIANNLPKNINLVVKEHPVNPGMISNKEIKKIKKEYKNIFFVDPSLHIRPLIIKSLGLITINSTAGIEALICNKKIIVLGESYYKHNTMAYKPKNEKELRNCLQDLINNNEFTPESTKNMLKQLLNQSYPSPNEYPSKQGDANLVVGAAIKHKIEQVKSVLI